MRSRLRIYAIASALPGPLAVTVRRRPPGIAFVYAAHSALLSSLAGAIPSWRGSPAWCGPRHRDAQL